MWWSKKVKSERTRRDELIEARDKLRRQVEILKMENPTYYSDGVRQNDMLIANLSSMLSEIEAELQDGSAT